MQYEEYKVEDFLFDEFFVRWVKNPGPETDHFWNAWIEENPGKVETINQAREIINSISYKNQYQPSENEYNKVLERILKKNTSWTQLNSYRNSDRVTSVIRYAAAFLVLVSFFAVMIFMGVNNRRSTATDITSLVKKRNPPGQKTTFKLSDGTIVKLNAGSKLTYSKVFTGKERRVMLEGEAFFDVKRDEYRPFVVETKYLTTIVLGTSFNIKSYPDDDESSVAVASGKVKVMKSRDINTPGSQYYLLNKNQMVTYNLTEKSITKKEAINPDVFAWKDNIILFEAADFPSVIKTLKRWYGVEFIIRDKKVFAGRFNAKYEDEPLDLVLEGLKGEYGFDYEIDGKKVFIY